MAEVLYVHFLIIRTTDSSEEQERLERILGWSQEPVALTA